jgi:tetratricopeptide (TPR) repeat protein
MNNREEEILSTLEEARQLYLSQNYPEALKKYAWLEKQLKDDPVNLPIIWIEYGWTHYYQKNFLECISYLKKAENHPSLNEQQKFDCFRLIGFSYASLNNSKLSIKNLNEALRFEVEEESKKYIYFELGKIYYLVGDFSQAQSHLEKASKNFAVGEQAYHLAIDYYLGFINYYGKEFEQAKSSFNEIIRKAQDEKTRATGYFGMAHIFHDERQYFALIEVCQKILKLDNNFYDKETLGFFFCQSYLNLKKFDQLRPFLDELMKNYPEGRYKSYYNIFNNAIKN